MNVDEDEEEEDEEKQKTLGVGGSVLYIYNGLTIKQLKSYKKYQTMEY